MAGANPTPLADGVPGGATSSDPPGSSAARELLDEQLAFFAEVRPLAESFLRLAKARGELLLFVGAERGRLFLGRQFAWIVALLLFTASWIFMSVFVWRGAISLTGQSWVGPLALALIHLAAGAATMSWRATLRL